MTLLRNLRRIAAIDNGAPPPYTIEPQNARRCDDDASDISQDSLYSFQTSRASVTRFQRFLIEIMAYTFKADFEALNTLLCQDKSTVPSGSTILIEDEKNELLRLALLVEDLRQKLICNQFNTTLKRDRDIITDTIVKPAIKIRLDPDYALDLISTYADHQCDADKSEFTLVSMYTPRLLRFRSYKASEDLRKTLGSHAKVIRTVSFSEPVQMILGQALASFQKNLGLQRVYHGYVDYCWPVRIGFLDLKSALDPRGHH